MTSDHDLKDSVRQGYGAVAKAGLSSEHDGMRSIAQAFGYSAEELASIPAEANMGLSCGNPTALASLRPGETVVDLGSGGGLDVFLAARQVGPTGTAIGIDMTPEMISLARRNAEVHGYANVRFHLAELEAIPLPDASVDCVISNCVLNLCPDKDAVLREVARILKPGGRLAVSDIALKQPLPPAVEREVAAWTGCIAGALTIGENEAKLRAAGFTDVLVQDAGSDLNAYRDGGNAACCGPASDVSPAPEESAGCCTPSSAGAPEANEVAESSNSDFHTTMDALLDTFDVNAYAASVKIYAVKPAARARE